MNKCNIVFDVNSTVMRKWQNENVQTMNLVATMCTESSFSLFVSLSKLQYSCFCSSKCYLKKKIVVRQWWKSGYRYTIYTNGVTGWVRMDVLPFPIFFKEKDMVFLVN